MTTIIPRSIARVLASGAALSLAVLAGCELEVTNPGPIQASELGTPSAITALVNGAGRDLAEALNWVSYTTAAVAREIHPAGSTDAFGISVRKQAGKLAADDGDTWWNFSQRARWTAENAVSEARRILGTSAANNVNVAQALIWTGFSNRLLGENFCDGVINGGPKEASTVYLARAEAAFTDAIAVAGAANNANLVTAATAGRASVRLLRNNTTGAAADAAVVSNNAFVYRMPYYTTDLDQYNRIYWSTANQPYRAHTVWNTWMETYRKTTRDPRVPFDSSATQLVGDAAVGNLGRVRWYFQTKFPAQTSPINLVSGWEMRLIEAEVKLIANDITGAMALINARRTNVGVPTITATTAEDAWIALKRERGIELWMEARRLGDFRRWSALNRPGTLSAIESMAGRDLCYATPLSEIETNPNF
ncbi:MAG: RagB/SusD family nutrient uptake outer membrane protein [Gemmatimonadaceae bacterium]|nr:RagB/SusD family nutrient uptake outer membrane protein [Gemmatimonadaceae bacterium]